MKKKEINEDYVSFEIAKLLVEKGFKENLGVHYSAFGDLIQEGKYNWKYPAPTVQMAMKWIRENFLFHFVITPNFGDVEVSPGQWEDSLIGWSFIIVELSTGSTITTGIQKYAISYESAVEAALDYCLKNLIFPKK